MINTRYSLVFGFVFIEGIDDFSLIKELRVFEVGIFDFDCKLFVGFNVNSFIDLTERSSAQFFENFKLFCHNGVNHNSERFLK
jgi:hypothetical protein